MKADRGGGFLRRRDLQGDVTDRVNTYTGGRLATGLGVDPCYI